MVDTRSLNRVSRLQPSTDELLRANGPRDGMEFASAGHSGQSLGFLSFFRSLHAHRDRYVADFDVSGRMKKPFLPAIAA